MNERQAGLARNATFLFCRLCLVAIADVWAVKIILKAIGVLGYGTFTAVTGVVLLFQAVLTVLETTSNRFVSYEFGTVGRQDVSAAFSTVAVLSLSLAFVTVVSGETVGRWFVFNRLSVPDGFLPAVPYVLRAGEAVIALKMLRVPFTSLIYSAERMSFFALLGLAEAALTLAAACVPLVVSTDGLLAYSYATACGAVVLLLVPISYCRIRFPSIGFVRRLEWVRLSETGRFFLWNCLSAAGNLFKYRAVGVLLAVYAGMAFNATFGTALYAGAFVGLFSAAFQQAAAPVVYKLWAGGDKAAFAARTGRFTLVSLMLASVPPAVAVPFLPELTRVWLGADVPPQFAAFVLCIFLNGIADAVSAPLTSAILATGRVALYHGMALLFASLGFGSAWMALAAGLPPWSAVLGVAVSNVLAAAYRWCHLRIFEDVRIGFAAGES